MLLTGVVVILGGDSQTTSLKDENGVDLDAFGADSIARQQAGRPLTNKFVPVKGFDRANNPQVDDPKEPTGERSSGIQAEPGEYMRECAPERVGPKPVDPVFARPFRPRPRGVLGSEIYFRSNPRRFSRVAPPNKRGGEDWTRLTLKEYLCQVAPAPVREILRKAPDFVEKNQGRQMLYLVESDVMKEIFAASRRQEPDPVDRFPAISPNFIHETRVVRGGRFEYALKQGLSQVMVTAEAGNGEQNTVQVKNLGTYNNIITLSGYREKVFNVQVHNKLGVGADYLRMELENIPMAAGGSLELNIKPGIGGVELFSAGQEINATVNFEYFSRGESLNSRYLLREQEGLRVVPSTFITSNQLKVSRIDKIFGDSLSSILLQPMP
jgi:hypothetical protein